MVHFYLLLVYIHLYPKFDNFKRVMRVRGQEDGISVYRFREYIIPLAIRLSAVIWEIQWSARLDPYNHHPLYETVVTSMVDTLPLAGKEIVLSFKHF